MKQQSYKSSITILTIIGAILAGYSLYEHTLLKGGFGGGPSICNINAQFNCDAVNASAYSSLFGLPLAGFGLAFYLVFLLWNLRANAESERRAFNTVLSVATTGAVLFSLYLFYISKFVIGTVCLFCIGMYVVNSVLFVVAYALTESFVISFKEGVATIITYLIGFFSGKTLGRQLKGAVLYGAVILSVFGAPHLLSEYFKSQPVKVQPSEYTEWLKKPVAQIKIDDSATAFSDYRKGSIGAPITVVEFFDYQCGACRVFHQKLINILDRYKDSVSFVAKNFPLDMSCNKSIDHPMHEHSCFAASVARCSGEQGKFWEAHDLLITHDAIVSGAESEVVKRKVWLALDDLGIDTSAVHDCVETGRQLSKISSDIEEGKAAQLHGTPSVYINGRLTETAKVESVLAAIIQSRPGS